MSTRTQRLALKLCGLAALLAAAGSAQDDLNLLRKDSQQPFLFIIVDTSTSMGNELGTETYVEGNTDDPRSKLYAAKEALYEVFKDGTGFRFGMATFDQGEVRVQSKHWLYYIPETYTDPLTGTVTDQGALLSGLTIGWPTSISTGLPLDVGVAPDGDLMTFGKDFPSGTTSFTGNDGRTCDKAINVATVDGRRQANRIPKLGEDGASSTDIWVKFSTNGTKYKVRFALSAGTFGAPTFTLYVDVHSSTCVDPLLPIEVPVGLPQTVTVQLERQFLLWDDPVGASGTVDFNDNTTNRKIQEKTAGYWSFSDVQGSWSCNDKKPFSGNGWEGNYDTTASEVPGDGADEWCSVSGDPSSCRNLKLATVMDTTVTPHNRALDVGDVLPFSWVVDTKIDFLKRLNPKYDPGDPTKPPDFGAAAYFEDTDAADGTTDGLIRLKSDAQKPLIAAGATPIGTAMLDFRCWYAGFDSNKCKSSAQYTDGFTRLQRKYDLSFQCRRPYLIIIGDSEENCGDSNNWNSAISNFTGVAGKDQDGQPLFGQVWVLNVGKGSYPTIGKNDGQVIQVAQKQTLIDELRKIKGIIEEETRAFASAAVPSVQADVADKIYLTSFEPVDGLAYWRGHADAYLKPLPIKIDIATGASIPDPTDPRHLWDASEKVANQVSGVLDYTQPTPPTIPIPTDANALSIGTTKTTRRVYYPRAKSGDSVPRTRELLAPASGPASDNPQREDLYQGLGTFDPSCPLGSTPPALFNSIPCIKTQEDATHTILVKTLYKKTANILGSNRTYILGDTFHANPLVIGGPNNQGYLAHPDEFPDYDKFRDRLERRRNILFLAANDGQLHAFDAGRFVGNVTTGKFDDRLDNDGGTELFSWVPRTMLSRLTAMAGGVAEHVWSMDGTPIAFDAFIDVSHSGTPDPDEREWRTVLLGGFRQGGAGVYALDVTQPDTLTEDYSGTTLLGVRPSHTNVLPNCANSLGSGTTSAAGNELGCDDRIPYPSQLWEFTDDELTQDVDGTVLSNAPDGVADDTDLCPGPDIGETWSTPNIGAVLLAKSDASGNKVLDVDGNPLPDKRFVAVFGGGRDPAGKIQDPNDPIATCARGSNIYVLDVETGKILLKEAVTGSVAAEPAAVDTDKDGYLDRIYFATTSGIVYRMDIRAQAATKDGRVIPENFDWQAWPIFDATTKEIDEDGMEVITRRSVFFRPAILFLPDLNEYAVAITTGSRDNMWRAGPVGGNRMFVFTDDYDETRTIIQTDPLTYGAFVGNPRTEANLVDVVSLEASQSLEGLNLLVDDPDPSKPNLKRGWFLRLMGPVPIPGDPRPNEVAVTPVTALIGLTSFSTFIPNVSTADAALGKLCLQRGTSLNYLAFTDNGDGAFDYKGDTAGPDPPPPPPPPPAPGETSTLGGRATQVGDVFVSAPFAEQCSTKNEVAAADDPCDAVAVQAITAALKERIFPSNCRFANYCFNLKTMRSDTGIECIAQVPVCIVEKNWKEF